MGKNKTDSQARAAARAESRDRDRKRDRDGWKAARQNARKAKRNRRDFEAGEKF